MTFHLHIFKLAEDRQRGLRRRLVAGPGFSLAGFPVADFISGSTIMVFCRGCSARVIIPGENFPTGFPFEVSGEDPGRGFRWQVFGVSCRVFLPGFLIGVFCRGEAGFQRVGFRGSICGD